MAHFLDLDEQTMEDALPSHDKRTRPIQLIVKTHLEPKCFPFEH